MEKLGFTLLEIVIVIFVLGLLAVLAIPGLLRARVNTVHSMIQSDLRIFSAANETYRSQQSPPRYSPDVNTMTQGNAPYIDVTWNAAITAAGRRSYQFTYTVDAAGVTYSMIAVPLNTNGVNTYCVDQTSLIVGGNGGTAPAGTVNGCAGGTPIG